jgi:hypothetical protein
MTAWAAVPTPQARIITPIDETKRVVLAGNTRPEASTANDLGQVEEGLPMEHMLLLLKPSAEQQASLDAYTASLTDKGSPNYHQWLTADEFGTRYGVAQSDIEQVTSWLASHGLIVNVVYPNNLVIDFSGTAGTVRETFGVEIHSYIVDGARHIANASDPKIPTALAGVVEGVVSLHDFLPRTGRKAKPAYTFSSSGLTYEAVTPADLATIYNLTPVLKAGYTGTGPHFERHLDSRDTKQAALRRYIPHSRVETITAQTPGWWLATTARRRLMRSTRRPQRRVRRSNWHPAPIHKLRLADSSHCKT